MSREERTHIPMHDGETTNTGDANSFDELGDADRKDTIFGKLNARFQDAIQEGRSEDALREVRSEVAGDHAGSADDLAIRRSKSISNPQHMTVPEGVVIEGALSSSSETDVAGKIDGDVTVEGNLALSKTAQITGKIRATTCSIDGLSKGSVECDSDLLLGKGGEITSNVMAGNRAVIAGTVKGNIQSGGSLELTESAEVKGNIKARTVVIAPGAIFNGTCTMGTVKAKSKK